MQSKSTINYIMFRCRAMMLYIFPYHIICNLLSYCSEKISLLPKMTTPKLFFNPWKLFENLTSRNTFNYSYNLGNRISWRKRNQYVNMIFSHFTTVYLKIKMTGDLKKKLLYPLTNFINKNFFSVFWAPNQMVLGFINCMTRSFQAHAFIVLGKHPFLKPCRKKTTRL